LKASTERGGKEDRLNVIELKKKVGNSATLRGEERGSTGLLAFKRIGRWVNNGVEKKISRNDKVKKSYESDRKRRISMERSCRGRR